MRHAVSMQNIAASTEGMRVAFVNNTNQHQIDAETRNRPTTNGDRYPHHLDRILKLCNEMANQKRDGEPLATLMQMQVGLESAYFGKITMPISVPHKLTLKHFKLSGNEKKSKIDSGIFPFMVTPPGAMSKEAAFRQDEEDDAMLYYGVIYEGANGISLAEAQAIHKYRVYLPLN